MTKAYTLNRLINEVANLDYRKVRTYADFVDAISPRAGASSRKVEVLNSFLFGELTTVAKSTTFGNTARTRVLRALKARKNNSF